MGRRAAALFPALLVCGALASAGIFHTWQRVEGIRLSYEMSSLTSEHRELLRRNEHLRLELATLKAPARIERLARRELGMAPPRPNQVIVIRNTGTAEALARRAREGGAAEAVASGPSVREEPRG